MKPARCVIWRYICTWEHIWFLACLLTHWLMLHVYVSTSCLHVWRWFILIPTYALFVVAAYACWGFSETCIVSSYTNSFNPSNALGVPFDVICKWQWSNFWRCMYMKSNTTFNIWWSTYSIIWFFFCSSSILIYNSCQNEPCRTSVQ